MREVGKVAAPHRCRRARRSSREPRRAWMSWCVPARSATSFPRGTVDAFDVWLELKRGMPTGESSSGAGTSRTAATGRWSGARISTARYQLDGEGNPINKRNAWQARSLLVRPADSARRGRRGALPRAAFRRMREGPITLLRPAELPEILAGITRSCLRRRSRSPGRIRRYGRDHNGWNTPSSRPAFRRMFPGKSGLHSRSAHRDGWLRPRPACRWGTAWPPVVRIASRIASVGTTGASACCCRAISKARSTPSEVTEAEPGYADGWLNVARALIQEGETEAAKPYIAKALAINPKLGRICFFKAMCRRRTATMMGRCASLGQPPRNIRAIAWYLNQIGRILFLKRDYAGAVAFSKRVWRVDPEDLQAHYNLMLCYRGLGDTARRNGRNPVQALQGGRSVSSHDGETAGCSVPKITTSVSPSTSTRAWTWRRRLPGEDTESGGTQCGAGALARGRPPGRPWRGQGTPCGPGVPLHKR